MLEVPRSAAATAVWPIGNLALATLDPDLLDAVHDAIVAMQGSADALSLRTVTDLDPLLELLADVLADNAMALTSAIE